MLKVKAVVSRDTNPDSIYIAWEEYQPFMKLNMEYQLFKIVDQVKSLGIKNLLFDPSCRQCLPSEDNFKAFYELFLSALADTGLEKFARISIADPSSEARFQKLINEIKEVLKVKFELRYFTDLEAARKWLGLEVESNIPG